MHLVASRAYLPHELARIIRPLYTLGSDSLHSRITSEDSVSN